jgi:uncharacterized protein with FMN-binding domain
MIKRRLIALIGFILGATLVIINYPSKILTSPQSGKSEEILKSSVAPSPINSSTSTPTPSPTQEVVSPTSTPQPTPKQEVVLPSSTPKPTPKQEVVLPSSTPKPTPTVSETKSTQNTIVVGDVIAAGKYGQVQVQITIKGGVVTAAKALIFPNADSRSSTISAMAIPQLVEQTINVMSSDEIQGVSGATYTSAAWRESLASALSGAL